MGEHDIPINGYKAGHQWWCTCLSSEPSLAKWWKHGLFMLNLSNLKMACKALHHLAPAQLSSLISQFCLPLDHTILALIYWTFLLKVVLLCCKFLYFSRKEMVPSLVYASLRLFTNRWSRTPDHLGLALSGIFLPPVFSPLDSLVSHLNTWSMLPLQ